MNALAPTYVVDMLSEYTPDRPLRSSNKGLLTIPGINTKLIMVLLFGILYHMNSGLLQQCLPLKAD